MKLLLLLLAAGSTAYQEDPAVRAKILRQLTSNRPAEIANGCYEAAEQGMQSVVPAIKLHLKHPPEGKWDRRQGCMLSVFDALIRLGASVNADEVLPWIDHNYANQGVILLLRDADKNWDGLLQVSDLEMSARPWFAVANVLVEAREPRVTKPLLAGLRLRLNVRVRAGPSYLPDGPGGGYGGKFGPADFSGMPPLFDYALNTQPLEDHHLLSAGPTSFYYFRYSHRGDRPATSFDDQEYRLTLLAQLAKRPRDTIALQPERTTEVYWRDNPLFLVELDALRGEIQKTYDTLCHRLSVMQLLLTEPPPLDLDVRLYDRRSKEHRDTPLPDLSKE